jgi:hypothetical protein
VHGGGDLGNVHFRVLTKKLAHEVSVLAKVGQRVRAVLGGEGRTLLRADVVGITAALDEQSESVARLETASGTRKARTSWIHSGRERIDGCSPCGG